jgi:hypothetical protein
VHNIVFLCDADFESSLARGAVTPSNALAWSILLGPNVLADPFHGIWFPKEG